MNFIFHFIIYNAAMHDILASVLHNHDVNNTVLNQLQR